VHDLLGCDVRTTAGARVGVVSQVQIGVGIPMLVVDADGDEVLIPLTEHIVRRVGVEDRRIEIDPPEGLIELNRRTGGRR
jgi:16S rRNA processing protein RimM